MLRFFLSDSYVLYLFEIENVCICYSTYSLVVTHTKHPVIKQGAKNNIEKNLTLNCLKNLIVSQK